MLATVAEARRRPQPADLIASPPLPCAVTGEPTTHYVAASSLFSDTFSDAALLASPGSGVIDASIAEVLADGSLRWRSWSWDEEHGIVYRSRWEVREMAIARAGLPEPFAIYAAEDMRRHGGLLARLSPSWAVGHVQFGRHRIMLAEFARAWPLALEASAREVWPSAIMAGAVLPAKLKSMDIAWWLDWTERMRPWRGTSVWAFVGWCLSAKPPGTGEDEPQEVSE